MRTKTGTRWTKWVEQPNPRQRAVLEALAELGRERAELVAHRAYMTSSGRRAYDQVIGKIRVKIDKGVELGLGHEQLREQVGVNSTAYYKIKGFRTAPEA
jgi:hypothetical protein